MKSWEETKLSLDFTTEVGVKSNFLTSCTVSSFSVWLIVYEIVIANLITSIKTSLVSRRHPKFMCIWITYSYFFYKTIQMVFTSNTWILQSSFCNYGAYQLYPEQRKAPDIVLLAPVLSSDEKSWILHSKTGTWVFPRSWIPHSESGTTWVFPRSARADICTNVITQNYKTKKERTCYEKIHVHVAVPNEQSTISTTARMNNST